MTSANATIDFGYPWWVANGHLVPAGLALLVLMVAYLRHWRRWTFVLPGLLLAWSVAAFAVMHVAMNVNGRAAMPTQSFLREGAGRVLDLGAGTGRSSIMLLQARPNATLVALDLFGHSYDMHFGKDQGPEQRLLANLAAAGVEKRATIVKADMRKLPFENASFDGIVSSYAIDHLSGQGITETLAEAGRVLKPGGQFLIMVVSKDRWLQFTFGPLLLHSLGRGPEWWSAQVKSAGFQVMEEGRQPATYYVLARRP